MARLSLKQKQQLKQDRETMSVEELTEKYGVSTNTVKRILADNLEKERTIKFSYDEPQESSNPDFDEFRDVLTGRTNEQPENLKEAKDSKKDPVREKAIEDLASNMFRQEVELPVVNVEDPVEKTAVLQRIMLNLDNFSPLFTFIHNKQDFVASLQYRSIEELKGILKTMEQTRTTLNIANQMKNTFLMIGKATEVLAPKVMGLKTDGFVDNLMLQRQELDMIFRELAIEYAPKFSFQSRPEVRLAMLYGMTLLQVDNTNRIKEYVDTKAKEQVPEETEKSFADL